MALLCLILLGAGVASPRAAAQPPGDSEAVEGSTDGGSRWLTRGVPEEQLYERPPEVPDDATIEAAGAVVGQVELVTLSVFDPTRPEENNFLFRTANRIHVTTRHAVVESKLLFTPGAPYSARLLRESERLLRSLGLFYDAWIFPTRYLDGVVDLTVVTRDVWTLSLSGGFERSGGENTWSTEALDSNFLGYGKLLSVKYEDDPDRSSFRVRYIDPALLYSRNELHLHVAENSDGHRRTLDLFRPFYSLDAPWSAGTRVVSDDRREKLYSLGAVVREVQHEQELIKAWGGLSKGLVEGRTHRWTFGYTYQEDRYLEGIGYLPVLAGRRTERIVSYPWVGFERVEDGFFEATDVDQLQRTEDFNLGTELRLTLGLSLPALGASQERLIAAGDLSFGFSRVPGELFFFEASAEGRFGEDDSENVVVAGRAEYYRRTFGEHQLYLLAEGQATWEPDFETQLVLGGDNGLRGYPRNMQSGDRRFLVTVEQRFYTDWHLLNLVYVGGAVFFDAGHAWYTEGPLARDDLGILKDVGIGLRLSSSRSSQGRMIHLDVAYPLDGGLEEVQWLVTSRETF